MNEFVPDHLVKDTVNLAAKWQRRANELLTAEEKSQQEQLKRLLNNPADKAILVKLFDQCFRSSSALRVAGQIEYLLKTHGTPEFFSAKEKTMVMLFRGIGRHFAGLTIPKMIEKMRQDSRKLIISGEPGKLKTYLEKRSQQRLPVNLNYLGDDVLGENEARGKLSQYKKMLKNPLVEYISIKISTLYSQAHPLGFDHSAAVISDRLGKIFLAAQRHTFTGPDGSMSEKFVNLDMEAYHDLHLTIEAFKRTLNRKEFKFYSAGIVLQSYLPEAYTLQQELTGWAKQRVQGGASPIKIRIVKGANMGMEHIEAALNNWPLATFDNKCDVDANFKRMVVFGMQPENIKAVRIGIGSHNLFELAFAWLLAKNNGVQDAVVFEMLEGMADHVRRALTEHNAPVLLYAPVADEKNFLNAIGYLIRRMDENSGPRNFLRHIPFLKTGSDTWALLKEGFEASCKSTKNLKSRSHRIQNRQTQKYDQDSSTYATAFINEPDTDWALKANRQWADAIRARWKKIGRSDPVLIPVVVAGARLEDKTRVHNIVDPNFLPENVVVSSFVQATEQDMSNAVFAAVRDPDDWRALSPSQRHTVLSKVANELRKARGDLIGAAAAETGMLFSEADKEVSEAVDLAEYYPFTAQFFTRRMNIESRGKGAGVVASPCDSPIAPACDGILACLAAGNTVIFKPDRHAILTGWMLSCVFWKAGISQNILQFTPSNDAGADSRLLSHPEVDFVIFHGSRQAGLQILDQRPDLFLTAAILAKNTTIVTAMASRDQAVKNVIYSAFGHAGQKSSSISLLILEKEVFQDPAFKNKLTDAAQSLFVGSCWQFHHRMGPLAKKPEGALLRGLTELERSESWALKPRMLDDNPRLWTPGIKWNVQPGSFTHLKELPGPVLGVMQADNLQEAIELANQNGFGLTAAIESLDHREIEQCKSGLLAGNLYINCTTSAKIVSRQPFGGIGKSALGPAIKSGGPDYVTQFMTIKESGPPLMGAIAEEHPLLVLAQHWEQKLYWGGMKPWQADIQITVRAIKNYLYHTQKEFLSPIDYCHLRGQNNLLHFFPVGVLMIGVHSEDGLFEVLARIAAAKTAGCEVHLNLPSDLSKYVTDFLESEDARPLLKNVKIRHLTDRQLAEATGNLDRLRFAAASRVPRLVYQAAARHGVYIAREPVLMDGRIEMLHYFMSRTICNTYHRYGNLGARKAYEE
ncbi:MAG: bifunctional proline dehydrogenase/L-glutamate gamma-semialdehyde dehydrogenase [Desulfobacteraceae bacterium]|nr:bifunctional proline dehydrogenase/L-glutamate gamma-semialdehyde dehydrogenase [Desulfobacteraceae bacterium]